jgi:exopolysaccharide biosynthesis protein
MALGRGPLILQNKKVVITCNGNEEQIRPRSVIAWNTKGQIWFFTATSGINMIDNGFRVGGATAHQMAEIAQQFGATEAVRVDGGGSTTMIIKSKGTLQRLDLPNEAWQRPIPVGIAMVAKSK